MKIRRVVFASFSRKQYAVLVSPAREAVRHPDVKNRLVPVRNDIDPEVVITRHASEI